VSSCRERPLFTNFLGPHFGAFRPEPLRGRCESFDGDIDSKLGPILGFGLHGRLASSRSSTATGGQPRRAWRLGI
jgi:hypothetical protein